MAVCRMRTLSTDEIEDRAYRLVNNESQNKVDRYSAIGALSGATVGAISIGRPLVGGFVGIAGGVAAYLAVQYGLGKELRVSVRQSADQLPESVQRVIPSAKTDPKSSEDDERT